MALGAAPGGLPPIGAAAVLLGMQQFNQSVRQVTTGLGQINSASVALERNSVLASTRMTSAFASLSSAYVTGGARMAATFGLLNAGLAGVAVAATAAGVAATTSAASFEKAITPVRVFGDLTTQQTEQISSSVLQMSRTWGVAAGSIAKGETALVKAGASFADLNGPLSEAVTLLNVASENELSMAESADIVTQGLRSWKLPTTEAINFVNALVGAVNASTAGFTGFVHGLGQSQAMAAAAGVSYRDLFAILGELNDENIRGERAGTAYRNLLLRMLSPTKDVAGVMLRYNLSLSDANGNMITAREFIERLSNAFSDTATTARGLTRAQVESDLATLGMSRSLLGALAIANQGTAAFDRYQRAIDKTDVRKIAQAFSESTVRQAQIFAANINAIAIAFGGPFNESLGRAFAATNKWLQSINLAQVRAVATIIRDQLGGAISYVAGLAQRGLGTLGSIFGNATGGTTAGNAILGIINLVIVRVQQARDIWNSIWANQNVVGGATRLLDSLGKLADAVLPRLQLAFATIGEILTYVIPRAVDAIPWGAIADAAETAVSETIRFLDGGYKQVAQSVYDTAVGVVNDVIAAVNATITAIGTAASSIVSSVFDTARGIADAVLSTLAGIVTGVQGFVQPFAENVQAVFDFVLEMAQRVVRSIGRAFEPLVEYVSKDVPGSFGPTLEVFKTVLAVLIVVERAWLRFIQNVVQAAAEGFVKYLPYAIRLVVNALQAWVQTQANVIRVAVATFELAAEVVRVFAGIWRDQMRSSAQAVVDFGQFVIQAFTGVYQWLEQQPVIGQFFKDLHTQFDQTKLAIDNLFGGIASAPGDAFASIRNAVQQVMRDVDTAVVDVRKTVDDVIGSVGSTVTNLGAGMQQAFDEAKGVVAGILPTLTNAGEGVRRFLEAMIDSARARINSATPEAQKFLKTIEDILANIKAIPAPGAIGGAQAGTLRGGPGETEGIGFPQDQARAMQNFVRNLLRDVPALTDEFTEFVAKLVEADPNRLNGIVAALQSQRGILQEIGRIRLEVLQTEIKIAEVDERLNAIHLQQQRIQIQMQQASLPFEQQLLTLREQSLRVEAAMLPFLNQIADIDRQIALLQRENLGLRMRELQIRQAMMPIQNQIADIEQRIADTQRENYALAIRAAQLQLQMLPVQHQIEDIEKQIARNNQENYGLARQRLQLEQAMLPARRAVENIESQINALNRDNYDLIAEQLDLQLRMMPHQERIAELNLEIAEASRTNYESLRRLAELDQQSLPVRQRIAEIEQLITNLVDRRAQLMRDRTMLIAEHDLHVTERSIKQIGDQLEELWSRFGTAKGAQRTALIPQILDLEKQRKQLEESLKPAQALVDKLKEQQDEIDFNTELARIGLQIQQAEQEALLEPINAQIAALKRQQEQEQALQAVTKARLEETRAAVEALLVPLERELEVLRQQQERERLRNEAAVNRLNVEKQLWQDILAEQEAQLLILRRLEEEQQLAIEIANTYLQEQLQQLQRVLERYQNELTLVQRQQQAYSLRNEIVRLGLEQEKSRLEALLRVWQDQLTAVERERAAEELRNQIAITGLEQQKRRLEELLAPIERAKEAIDRQTAAITLQQQLAKIAYEQQLLALQKSELENELYKNQLETIRELERQRLAALIQQFQEALAKSGAFSSSEIIESTKRLNLWQGEVNKLAELKTSYTNLQSQLNVTQPYNTTQVAVNNLNGVLSTLATNSSNAFTQTNNVANAMNGARTPVDTMHNSVNALSAAFLSLQDWERVTKEKSDAFTNSLPDAGLKVDNMRIQINNLGQSYYYLAGAIDAASAANSNYIKNAAKNIAAEAAATALGSAMFNAARAQGLSFYESARSAYANVREAILGGFIGYADGGFVRGTMDQPQLAVVHGGEYVVSRPEQRELTSAITRAITTYNQQQTTVNYNFTASYERQQDPVTASMDMRALIELTR